MGIFSSVIFQIAVLFSFILIGFILRRLKVIPEQASRVLSRLENCVLMPAVVINTFSANCTLESITQKWIFIVYSTGVLIFCVAAAFVISKLLSKDEYMQKIYRYSISVSNFGFVGTAMVSGIYGGESKELFDYLVFTLPLNMFTYSIGISWLVPEQENKKRGFSLKSFLNPIFVSLFIGAAIGLLSLPRPKLFTTVVSSAASCMSPIAMLLTGFVIGGYSLLELFKSPKTYIVAAVRLLLLPACATAALRLIGAPEEIIIATLCANAMPLGLNTVIIPAAYGKPVDTGAGMALVSQLGSVVTIPLLFYFWVG